MQTIEYKTLDKSKWGDGPWQDEPDKKQWLDNGGLTFAGACETQANVETGICHTVEENENDNIWWFGFDCAHGGDHMPAFRVDIDHVNAIMLQSNSYAEMIEKLLNPMQHSFTGKYRDINYVTKETLSLAQQLHGMQPTKRE